MKETEPLNPIHLKFAVLAVDVVLFTIKENELYVRLVSVNRPPFFPAGSLGFPGGLIDPSETAEDAVMRHLENKAGVEPKDVFIEQLYTFSAIDRDPRGRVVAVSYLALTSWENLSEKEQMDTESAYWLKYSKISKLAYDHNAMMKIAIDRLKSRISYTTMISKVLPSEFTLGELEKAYTIILNKPLDKRNFRKKIAKLNILDELPYKKTGESYRPAKLYKFKSTSVEEIEIL